MATLSFAELEGYWVAAGGSPALAPLMAAIALAESSGDPSATNPTDNGGRQTSWGLWQISNGDHSEPSPNWADPLENARLAVGKNSSQGLRAWGTYTSGAYKRFLQGGVEPVPPSGGGAPTGGGGVSRTGLLSTFGPWLGTILGGGLDPVTALAGTLGTVLGPISNTFSDFDHALTNAMHAVLWLVNPRNWVRIVSGVAGAAAAITGAVLIASAA